MSKYIVIDNTKVTFNIPGPTYMGLTQTTIAASGPATISGTKVCVIGDESKVELPIGYTAAGFTVPGKGKMIIKMLLPDQIGMKTNSGGKSVILQGAIFMALFIVETPAQIPPPVSTPDPMPMYIGTGKFEDNNTKFSGA
ncbi:MAG: hypothetical protein AAF587_16955 [Bacteroidota bacterium]